MTEETALAAAKNFLEKLKFSHRYLPENPVIYQAGDEFHVEFQDKQDDTEPGVCIIAVDKKTGTPRLEPVE